MLAFATLRTVLSCNCLYAKTKKTSEKLGPLVNEEKKKINDNSEITKTDSTLGICPSYSRQWPVTSTPPPPAQIHKANKKLYCNCSLCCIQQLNFNFYLCFVFWGGGRLHRCSLMPEILTEEVKRTLKNERLLLFAGEKL